MTNPIHFPSQMRWTSVALLLALLTFAFRIHHLGAQALSADEAFTVVVWNQGTLNHLLTQTALTDPQPPATLLGIVGWLRLVGDSEFAVRYISLLASLITLASLCKITESLLGARPALLSCFLGAINPFQFWYAQDIRSYSLWMAVSAFALLSLLKALKGPDNLDRWILYILAATLGLFTFYLELFVLVAHNLFAIIHHLTTKHSRTAIPVWVATQLGIALLAAPWYLRSSLRSSGYHPTAVVRADFPWLFETLLFGTTLPPILKNQLFTIGIQHFSVASLLAILLFLAGLISLITVSKTRAAWFVAIFTLSPMLLLAALTTISGLGFFRPRYLAPASIALVVALAALLNHLLTAGRWQAAVSATLALITATISISSIWWYRTQDPKSPPWRDIVAFLETQPAPGDVIIRNFPDPSFDYYYSGPLQSTLLPVDPDTPPTETYEALTALSHQYDSLWFMPVPYISYDPDQLVAHWLYDNDQLVSEHWFDTTHIIQFANWDVDSTDIENPLYVTYAQTAILLGYNITPTLDRWTVGQTITFELFWQPIQQTAPLLTVFFHVLAINDDASVSLLTQDDQWPQEGRVTTQTWEPGKLYRDVHTITLPPSPDGNLIISAGFYSADTSERIPIELPSPAQLIGPDSPLLFTYSLP